jgi:thiol-disulfide isomerase/thioredoxin
MIERIWLTLAIMASLVLVYLILTRLQIRFIGKRGKRDELLSILQPGIPGVIYFWSEACAPCITMQKPALEQLAGDLGASGVQIITVNAVNEPEIANRWGVLALPTTFIVDGLQRPRRVNHGVVRYDQLKQQIVAVGQIVKENKVAAPISGKVWKEYRVNEH